MSPRAEPCCRMTLANLETYLVWRTDPNNKSGGVDGESHASLSPKKALQHLAWLESLPDLAVLHTRDHVRHRATSSTGGVVISPIPRERVAFRNPWF